MRDFGCVLILFANGVDRQFQPLDIIGNLLQTRMLRLPNLTPFREIGLPLDEFLALPQVFVV